MEKEILILDHIDAMEIVTITDDQGTESTYLHLGNKWFKRFEKQQAVGRKTQLHESYITKIVKWED